MDEVVCFNPLTEENFRGIAALMLGEVRDLLAEKNISLTWDEALIDYLVKTAYSLTYGARNLRRTIQKQIEDEIAAKLVERRGTPTREIFLGAADGKVTVELR